MATRSSVTLGKMALESTTLVNAYRMARMVLMAEVRGGRLRGRLRLGWREGVNLALGNKRMMVEAARQCAKDRKEWTALVHM